MSSMTETSVYLTFFRVRIERAGIDEIVANAVRPEKPRRWIKPAPPTPLPITQPEPAHKQTITEDPEEEQRGPRVAEDQLRAWYELYKRAFPGAADTEPNAIKSAMGMFHNKSVPRSMIRELRGTQKPGRKPRDDTAAG
jgi:hypothetical protein